MQSNKLGHFGDLKGMLLIISPRNTGINWCCPRQMGCTATLLMAKIEGSFGDYAGSLKWTQEQDSGLEAK